MQEMIINWWAVIVGAVAINVIGFIWYGPLFGKVWGNIIGMPPASEMSENENKDFQKKMGPVYLLNFFFSIWTAYVISFYVAGWTSAGTTDITNGIMNAFWIWIGFLVPVLAGSAMWSGKSKKDSWKMFGLTAGYYLVSFIVLGAIIGGWK